MVSECWFEEMTQVVAPSRLAIHDSLAEWSKALASGASPQGRGFEPHSCHFVVVQTRMAQTSLRKTALVEYSDEPRRACTAQVHLCVLLLRQLAIVSQPAVAKTCVFLLLLNLSTSCRRDPHTFTFLRLVLLWS